MTPAVPAVTRPATCGCQESGDAERDAGIAGLTPYGRSLCPIPIWRTCSTRSPATGVLPLKLPLSSSAHLFRAFAPRLSLKRRCRAPMLLERLELVRFAFNCESAFNTFLNSTPWGKAESQRAKFMSVCALSGAVSVMETIPS